MKRRVALSFLFVACLLEAVDISQAGRQWWAHVQYLADDALEGRKAGTEGHRKAAAYVAEQFEKAGLKPGTPSGFLQSVAFHIRQIVSDRCSAVLVRGGEAIPFQVGHDLTIAPRGVSGKGGRRRGRFRRAGTCYSGKGD